MKRAIFTALFLVLMVMLSFGQNVKKYRQVIEIESVPKKVKTEFNAMYPGAFVKMWYVTHISYWYQDYGPSYYDAWYKPRNVVVYDFSNPSNYEVEFMYRNENSRAIFNRYGVWFETRTRVSDLPDSIRQIIQTSEYYDWLESDYKERIDAPGMNRSVYRMQMSKRLDSQIIRINEVGNIIQVKSE